MIRMNKGAIKISTARGTEFSSDVVIHNEKYLIETDCGTAKHPVITTQIYLKGSILDSIKTNYSDLLDDVNAEARVIERMRKQHQSCVNRMQAEKRRREKSLADYAAEVKQLIESKRYEEAFSTLAEKLELHPDDPTLLSYRGLLEGLQHKRYRDGISICKKAIESVRKKMLFGSEFFYPVLYINLGKTYLAGGNRREALTAFRKALKVDRDNAELKAIFAEIGVRRSPSISFLPREHLLNKYIGKLTYRRR